MEKKTIIPEKNKKYVFIENLIFCILIILVSIGGIIAWFCIQSKQNDIITNESMQLVEDTQKGVYYNSTNNTNYNENYTYLTNATQLGNNYLTYNNNSNISFGLGGNSFKQYIGNNNYNDYINVLDEDNVIEIFNQRYTYSFLNFIYSFDNDLYDLIPKFNRSTVGYDFDFLPILSIPSQSFNFIHFLDNYYENDYFSYVLCSIDFIDNTNHTICNLKYNNDLVSLDNNQTILSEESQVYFTNYSLNNINITLSDAQDGYFHFVSNNFNSRISYININYYLASYVDINDFYTSNLDGLCFGLCSTCNYDLWYLYNALTNEYFYSDLLDTSMVVYQFFNYLPNYYKFVDKTLYQNSFQTGYDEGYQTGYDTGFDNGTINGYSDGFNDGVSSTLDLFAEQFFTTNSYVNSIVYSYIDDYGVRIPLHFEFEYGDDELGSYVEFSNLTYQTGYTNVLTLYFTYSFLPSMIKCTTPFTNCFNGSANVSVSYFGDGIYGVDNANLDKFSSSNFISLAWDSGYPTSFKLYIQGFTSDIKAYEDMYNKGYDLGYETGSSNGFTNGKIVGYNQGLNASSTTGGLITSLFTNVANVPVIIFNGLFPASVLNIPIISILFGMLAIAVIIFLIRKFI